MNIELARRHVVIDDRDQARSLCDRGIHGVTENDAEVIGSIQHGVADHGNRDGLRGHSRRECHRAGRCDVIDSSDCRPVLCRKIDRYSNWKRRLQCYRDDRVGISDVSFRNKQSGADRGSRQRQVNGSSASQQIVPRTAIQHISAATTDDDVVTALAENSIIAHATENRVLASATLNGVISIATDHRIVPGTGIDGVSDDIDRIHRDIHTGRIAASTEIVRDGVEVEIVSAISSFRRVANPTVSERDCCSMNGLLMNLNRGVIQSAVGIKVVGNNINRDLSSL